MTAHWLIYGAYGFTGQLLAEEAVRRGHRPTLAGRSREKLEPLAARLGLPSIAIELSADAARLRDALAEHALVFHAAGPFVFTCEPMVRACLDARTHYLDLSGEIDSLERVFSLNGEARERGVVLLPAAGFDVIASDCLVRYVAERVTEPRSLDIAIAAIADPSVGTLKSALEILSRGGRARRNGVLVPSQLGGARMRVRFSGQEKIALAFPGPDLVTAFHTAGARDITTYMALGHGPAWALRIGGSAARWALASRRVRAALGRLAGLGKAGPGEAARQSGRSFIWVRATSGDGQSAEAWLETMEGYRFTAAAGVRVAERVLELWGEGRLTAGATTPARALGADFVLEIPETRRLEALSAEYV
ncbi:MAG TPA: saccharopine dehydrogenase NADP-binding domain-containing protein [Myxococcaceae bacterium]|nr:saccharopine dehydrogenase NADP-binding domain-containing protein [Myxococcaceae bacterium]